MSAQRQHRAVQVLFRDLQPIKLEDLDTGGAYTYAWRYDFQPTIGQWVYVVGYDGPTTAVIAALGRGESARGMKLEPVVGIVPPEQVAQAATQAAKERAQWFDQARKAAGLPAYGKPPRRPLPNYPAVPPATGTTKSREQANDYGGAWWRIYKQAQEDGLPANEVMAFKNVAQHWYNQRDTLPERSPATKVDKPWYKKWWKLGS